jgi:heat shock protein HslJ
VNRDQPAAPGSQRPAQGSAAPLEKTYWQAIEIAGKPVAGDSNRDVHLVFEAGERVSGSDGCNRVTGTYQLTGTGIKFGPLLGTQLACRQGAEVERAFRTALVNATQWRIVGNRLELSDAANMLLVRFESRADRTSTLPPQPTARTGDTSWQLVNARSAAVER